MKHCGVITLGSPCCLSPAYLGNETQQLTMLNNSWNGPHNVQFLSELPHPKNTNFKVRILNKYSRKLIGLNFTWGQVEIN